VAGKQTTKISRRHKAQMPWLARVITLWVGSSGMSRWRAIVSWRSQLEQGRSRRRHWSTARKRTTSARRRGAEASSPSFLRPRRCRRRRAPGKRLLLPTSWQNEATAVEAERASRLPSDRSSRTPSLTVGTLFFMPLRRFTYYDFSLTSSRKNNLKQLYNKDGERTQAFSEILSILVAFVCTLHTMYLENAGVLSQQN
jgi:hypothetical protein